MLEQHVDVREENRLRDNSDVSKLTEWSARPSSIPTKPWIDVHEYWCRQ